MSQGHAALHEWVRRRVDGVAVAAMRADPQAIAAFVHGRPGLDAHTRDFLRDARNLALTFAIVFTAVLEHHRPDGRRCQACGTLECRTLRRVAGVLAAYSARPVPIDRAEAWRRADARLARCRRPATPLGIEPFEHGFVAWPAFDIGEGDFVLVVDRLTGTVTRWPRLSPDVLTREYGSRPPLPNSEL
ncbi:hypothetical protein Acsp03_70120 [Actinomadura sp. NBRC 104412]|uniref:hypothetical protein n=1 Tax=Actinomadura sp. NBRC 104412 TaxID=3032203 RepID=UPI0024A0885E|nr:hypothetical protein [Actinomadura sp. NBRC 104412]GLZ09546.1 hypothetical protein Acsp03_70120 [Actinomadura sp. NBRC 104412]